MPVYAVEGERLERVLGQVIEPDLHRAECLKDVDNDAFTVGRQPRLVVATGGDGQRLDDAVTAHPHEPRAVRWGVSGYVRERTSVRKAILRAIQTLEYGGGRRAGLQPLLLQVEWYRHELVARDVDEVPRRFVPWCVHRRSAQDFAPVGRTRPLQHD